LFGCPASFVGPTGMRPQDREWRARRLTRRLFRDVLHMGSRSRRSPAPLESGSASCHGRWRNGEADAQQWNRGLRLTSFPLSRRKRRRTFYVAGKDQETHHTMVRVAMVRE